MALYDPGSSEPRISRRRRRVAGLEGGPRATRGPSRPPDRDGLREAPADRAPARGARRRVEAREALARREARALPRGAGRRSSTPSARRSRRRAPARGSYAAESDRRPRPARARPARRRPRHGAPARRGGPRGRRSRSLRRPMPSRAALARDPRLRALTPRPRLSSARRSSSIADLPADGQRGGALRLRAARFRLREVLPQLQENVASVGVSVVLPVLTGGRETPQAAPSRARLAPGRRPSGGCARRT